MPDSSSEENQPSLGGYSVSPFLKQEVSDQIRRRDPNARVSWNWYDTWQEEHHRAFVVAKMCKADLLQEVHDSLQKAVDTGMTFEEWKKDIVPKLEGKWLGRTYGDIWENDLGRDIEDLPEKQRGKIIAPKRLETIYRTNMKVAHAAGQYESLMDMADLYPYWRYNTQEDERVRKSHAALNNKVFRYDDPFWDTHYPPNGWNCRCYVRAMDENDLEDEGLTVTDSRKLKTVTEASAGDHTKLAYIIDGNTVSTADGWNYNPGRIQHIDDVAEGKMARYAPELREQVARDLAGEGQPAPKPVPTTAPKLETNPKLSVQAEDERKAKAIAARAEAERQARTEAKRLDNEPEYRVSTDAEKLFDIGKIRRIINDENADPKAIHKVKDTKHRLQSIHAKAEQWNVERETKETAAKTELERLDKQTLDAQIQDVLEADLDKREDEEEKELALVGAKPKTTQGMANGTNGASIPPKKRPNSAKSSGNQSDPNQNEQVKPAIVQRDDGKALQSKIESATSTSSIIQDKKLENQDFANWITTTLASSSALHSKAYYENRAEIDERLQQRNQEIQQTAMLYHKGNEWIQQRMSDAKQYEIARHIPMERVVISQLPKEIITALRNHFGFSVASTQITLTNIQAFHFMRPSKQQRGVAIDIDNLKILPEILKNARFLYDVAKNNIVAVYDCDPHSKNILKIVLEIDHYERNCEAIKDSPSVSIRTIGREQRHHIKNSKQYKEIKISFSERGL